MTWAPKRRLRCAVYTRKSSEEGLDMDFNSLDAQREACEAYIASQKAEGWTLVPDHYDDGGFSGGNLDRPGLQRLMRDIEARSRSLPAMTASKPAFLKSASMASASLTALTSGALG